MWNVLNLNFSLCQPVRGWVIDRETEMRKKVRDREREEEMDDEQQLPHIL